LSNSSSKSIALVSILAALYIVASFIPVSMFIGAQSFLSLALIITPLIAVALEPIQALTCSAIAGIAMSLINPSSATFGLLTPLLPIMGATSGSIIYHRKTKLLALPLLFLAGIILFYTTSRPEFPYWVIPHGIAILAAIATRFTKRQEITIALTSFVATMCEQAAMLLLAVGILALPTPVFQAAFPLMLYERTIGTIGGWLILIALRKASRRIPALDIFGES
jgi:hypothetical protein